MKFTGPVKMYFVGWVWRHTPTCAEMSRLASRSLERPLSLKERVKARLHFIICAWCARYFQQIHLLHSAAKSLDHHEPGRSKGPGLSAEARARMVKQIRSAL